MYKQLKAILLAALGMGLSTVHGAYLIEVDTDGLDDGNISFSPDFSFGGDTTVAFQSSASSAIGLSGGDSIYGGNGSSSPDTYVFIYAPDSQADNQYFDVGTPLGDGNFASGATGSVPGRYAVYATWPATSNVTGGPTNYEIETAGDSTMSSIDQNGSGGFGNVWVKVGEIEYTSGPITVKQTATTNTSVSMRAAGVLFELLADVPNPPYDGPPGPVLFGNGTTQFLGLAFLRNNITAQSFHHAVMRSTNLVDWSTTDLKLYSVTDIDSDNQLVTFRSMTPMGGQNLEFLRVRAREKMPISEPPDPPKYVAITFDDGPDEDWTPLLLDMLAERNIRATFYVIGSKATSHPHIIRRMINEGHEVGNHSMTHADLTTLPIDDPDPLVKDVVGEVSGCHDAIVAAATVAPATIRPPYGALDENPGPGDLRALFLNQFGYPTILWDVDPNDWDMRFSDQDVIDHILTESDHGEIILAHDIHERTVVSVMPTVLDGLLAQGFSFVTITELLELQGATP